jgi:hypothetical protein
MFTKDMIAPCGLDCSICKRALAGTDPCAGCRGPNDNKPEFCSVRCGIILCEKRKSNGYSFCDPLPASLFSLIALGTSCMYDMKRG